MPHYIIADMFAITKTPAPEQSSTRGRQEGNLMEQFAVIKTGGKQYIVSPGQKLKIEKLPNKEGEEVVFDQVLLQETDPSTSSGQGILSIGTPLVQGAKVKGRVIRQGMGKKTIAYKYKAKKRAHSKKGHRQLFTEVEITEV